jgi:hypothetical protein
MTARVALALALLVATTAGAVAQVPQLINDVRWSAAPPEQQVRTDLSQRKTLVIPELPSAPTVNAQLDDEAWDAAARTDQWMVSTGERPAPQQTTAWAGTRDGIFYVAFRADEPNTEGIVAEVTEADGPTWNDDCFEMFVDGNLDLETLRQLIINPLGTVTTLAGRGEWNPEVTSAARIGDGAWVGEFALPMASLGVTGTDFGLNFCRERKAGGGNDLSCWSPTGGGFHQPGKFGLASLPGGWLQGFVVGDGVLGQNELGATIANPAATAQQLRVRLTWWQGEGLALERTRGPFTLEPGTTREIMIGYDVQQTGAPVHLELAVLNENDEIVAERQASQEIRAVLGVERSRRVLAAGERSMTIRATMTLSQTYLQRTHLVLAVFDREMILEAREVINPASTVMRAQLTLPPLEVGEHSLHAVLKSGEGDTARRVAEEKILLQVLPPVE